MGSMAWKGLAILFGAFVAVALLREIDDRAAVIGVAADEGCYVMEFYEFRADGGLSPP